MAYVTHRILADFADEKVNLRRDDVREYREQVQRLRDHLKTHIAEHPDYGFVKTGTPEASRKGTALGTINDMDLAVYVKAAEAPTTRVSCSPGSRSGCGRAEPLAAHDHFTSSSHCVRSSTRQRPERRRCPGDLRRRPRRHRLPDHQDTGGGLRTLVTQHLKFVRARKSAQPRHFAQAVRLLKWWVRQPSSRTTGFGSSRSWSSCSAPTSQTRA